MNTTAKVELRMVDGTPTITKIALRTEGVVEAIDEEHFHKHAEEAKAGCTVSKAMADGRRQRRQEAP